MQAKLTAAPLASRRQADYSYDSFLQKGGKMSLVPKVTNAAIEGEELRSDRGS